MAQRVALITGANSGIGFELAAQLLAKTNPTYHVYVGARSQGKGQAALSDLQSRKLPGTAELLHLDVTSDDLINAAKEKIQSNHGKLDLLVNNAAVAQPPGTLREQMNTAFDTNATGPLVLTEALKELLQKGDQARIVNVASGASSIERKLDASSPFHRFKAEPYRVSKTAMNMVFACQFVDFKDLGVKVFCYDPGYTISNLSDFNTKEKGAREASESVKPIVDVIEGKRDADADGGVLLHKDGSFLW